MVKKHLNFLSSDFGMTLTDKLSYSVGHMHREKVNVSTIAWIQKSCGALHFYICAVILYVFFFSASESFHYVMKMKGFSYPKEVTPYSLCPYNLYIQLQDVFHQRIDFILNTSTTLDCKFSIQDTLCVLF